MTLERKLLIAIAAAVGVLLVCQVWIMIDRIRTRRKFRRVIAGSGE